MVRKLPVSVVNDLDNVFFEICNEPGANLPATGWIAWPSSSGRPKVSFRPAI